MTNDNLPTNPIEERFTIALSELIGMCMEAGMHTMDMIEPLEKELKWLRNPYQNPKDNEPPRGYGAVTAPRMEQ